MRWFDLGWSEYGLFSRMCGRRGLLIWRRVKGDVTKLERNNHTFTRTSRVLVLQPFSAAVQVNRQETPIIISTRKHLHCRWKWNAGSSAANCQRRSSHSTIPSHPKAKAAARILPEAQNPQPPRPQPHRRTPVALRPNTGNPEWPPNPKPQHSSRRQPPRSKSPNPYTTSLLPQQPRCWCWRTSRTASASGFPLAHPRNSARRRHQSPSGSSLAQVIVSPSVPDDRNGYSPSPTTTSAEQLASYHYSPVSANCSRTCLC